jgi:hypothetical protein
VGSFFEEVTDLWHEIDPLAAKSTDYLVSKTMSQNDRIAGELGLDKLQAMAKYYEDNPRAAESKAAPIVLAALATAFSGGAASPTLAAELEAAQAADTAAGLMTAEDLAVINSGTGLADSAAVGGEVVSDGYTAGQGLSSADTAALYGPEGYGPGMTGGETAAYDTALGAGSRAGVGSTLGDIAKYGQYIAPLVTGYLGNQAAGKAADAQVQAGREANATTLAMYSQNRADLEPWRTAGGTALGQLSTGTAPGGDFNRDFTLADFNVDPGYQFRMDEGNKAIERSAAARGGLMSGATGKALQRFGQDTASGEYSNAYNRFNNDRTQRFNRLSGIAGTGQQTAVQVGDMGAKAANNIANTQQGIGNAQASGIVGGTNQITGGIKSLSDVYMQQQYLDQLRNRPPGG